MPFFSIRAQPVDLDPIPAWVLVAALAGIAATILLARRRRPPGIDPLRDRWQGEGETPVDARVAAAS
jgi:hypothetical protein